MRIKALKFKNTINNKTISSILDENKENEKKINKNSYPKLVLNEDDKIILVNNENEEKMNFDKRELILLNKEHQRNENKLFEKTRHIKFDEPYSNLFPEPIKKINILKENLKLKYEKNFFEFVKYKKNEKILFKINPSEKEKNKRINSLEQIMKYIAKYEYVEGKKIDKSFFTAVKIFDSYISKSKSEKNLEILIEEYEHIAKYCFLMAFKNDGFKFYNDDAKRLKNDLLFQNKGDFQVRKEFDILLMVMKTKILTESNFYDHLKFYFDDLNIHNEIIIENLKIKNLIFDIYLIALDFLKLTLHDNIFDKFDDLLLVITSILASFELSKNSEKFSDFRVKTFFKEWVLYIIEKSEYKNIQVKIVILS